MIPLALFVEEVQYLMATSVARIYRPSPMSFGPDLGPDTKFWVQEPWQCVELFYDGSVVYRAQEADLRKAKPHLTRDDYLPRYSVEYEALGFWPVDFEDREFPWRKAETMPRWASRGIVVHVKSWGMGSLDSLEATDVRSTGFASVMSYFAYGINDDPVKRFLKSWELRFPGATDLFHIDIQM